MADDFDPEMLGPVEKIRYAEALIRAEHWCTEDDWLFWGNLADYLNDIAHVPEKTAHTPADRRAFNRAQDMATGLIRMAAPEKASRTVTFDITAPDDRHVVTQALDDYERKETGLAAGGDNEDKRTGWAAAARRFRDRAAEA